MIYIVKLIFSLFSIFTFYFKCLSQDYGLKLENSVKINKAFGSIDFFDITQTFGQSRLGALYSMNKSTTLTSWKGDLRFLTRSQNGYGATTSLTLKETTGYIGIDTGSPEIAEKKYRDYSI